MTDTDKPVVTTIDIDVRLAAQAAEFDDFWRRRKGTHDD